MPNCLSLNWNERRLWGPAQPHEDIKVESWNRQLGLLHEFFYIKKNQSKSIPLSGTPPNHLDSASQSPNFHSLLRSPSLSSLALHHSDHWLVYPQTASCLVFQLKLLLMAMYIISRRVVGGSTPSTAFRYATCWRPYSTSFREERDTFGPILVPSDKFVFLCSQHLFHFHV